MATNSEKMKALGTGGASIKTRYSQATVSFGGKLFGLRAEAGIDSSCVFGFVGINALTNRAMELTFWTKKQLDTETGHWE
jgi:hypothetical protein